MIPTMKEARHRLRSASHRGLGLVLLAHADTDEVAVLKGRAKYAIVVGIAPRGMVRQKDGAGAVAFGLGAAQIRELRDQCNEILEDKPAPLLLCPKGGACVLCHTGCGRCTQCERCRCHRDDMEGAW